MWAAVVGGSRSICGYIRTDKKAGKGGSRPIKLCVLELLAN